MTWLTWLLDALTGHRGRPPVDPEQIRDEMTRTDPDFARVRQAQHAAMQALTARRLADGLAIRDERQFWQRSQIKRTPPEGRTDDG